jgi:hypothetical protein
LSLKKDATVLSDAHPLKCYQKNNANFTFPQMDYYQPRRDALQAEYQKALADGKGDEFVQETIAHYKDNANSVAAAFQRSGYPNQQEDLDYYRFLVGTIKKFEKIAASSSSSAALGGKKRKHRRGISKKSPGRRRPSASRRSQ